MIHSNQNYSKLQGRYLFREIARRVDDFQKSQPADRPGKRIIKLGIGDITEPLAPAVIEAMHEAVDDMADRDTFMGYGPEQGYDFLRKAIVDNDYRLRGVHIDPDEVFVSDGSKCDTANILDIFDNNSVVALTDPVYPVYVDTNVMVGRTGGIDSEGRYEGIVYIPCTAENNFIPDLPENHVDIIYLCYPNNPTGTALTAKQLQRWVDYAIENNAVIFFDAAYESYITEPRIPHSIYEIDGARRVAIEFRSFSKSAGFTGVRCAFTVVPKELICRTPDGRPQEMNALWNRRQTTKFNGVSYITQRAAAATYTPEGRQQVGKLVDFYLENASLIRETLTTIGLEVYGGVNSPYLWVKTPNNMTSWDYFQDVLEKKRVVITPGSGFGPSGEGYVRFSAFASRDDIDDAMERFDRYGA